MTATIVIVFTVGTFVAFAAGVLVGQRKPKREAWSREPIMSSCVCDLAFHFGFTDPCPACGCWPLRGKCEPKLTQRAAMDQR